MTPQKTAMNAEQKARELVKAWVADPEEGDMSDKVLDNTFGSLIEAIAAALAEAHAAGRQEVIDRIGHRSIAVDFSLKQVQHHKVVDKDTFDESSYIAGFGDAYFWVIERVRGK